MVQFDLWYESLIFLIIFSIVVIVPCIFVMLLGKKMINQLGLWPSKTPAIHMGMILPLVITEVITFFVLLLFYNFFSN